MKTKKEKYDHTGKKAIELCIDGHSVTLSFAPQPDAAAARRVRACLIDAYIRRNEPGYRTAAKI